LTAESAETTRGEDIIDMDGQDGKDEKPQAYLTRRREDREESENPYKKRFRRILFSVGIEVIDRGRGRAGRRAKNIINMDGQDGTG
jgi:hypothetical protein